MLLDDRKQNNWLWLIALCTASKAWVPSDWARTQEQLRF